MLPSNKALFRADTISCFCSISFMSDIDGSCSTSTSPLSFHVSSKWLRTTTSSPRHICVSKYLDPGIGVHAGFKLPDVTIDLNARRESDKQMKTVRHLSQLCKDLQTYRGQLHHMHGSIGIKTHASPVERCSCVPNRSSDICEQLRDFENEICQNDCVEYVYKIESITNKDSILV